MLSHSVPYIKSTMCLKTQRHRGFRSLAPGHSYQESNPGLLIPIPGCSLLLQACSKIIWHLSWGWTMGVAKSVGFDNTGLDLSPDPAPFMTLVQPLHLHEPQLPSGEWGDNGYSQAGCDN